MTRGSVQGSPAATEAAPGSAARRVFLGWDGPLLPRAADWLLDTFGADLADVVVALPGRRAVRRLEALLVERAAGRGLAGLSPPRILTAGHLGDELLLPQLPVASRLRRTLLWSDALAALPPADLRALFREPPVAGARAEWLAHAEDLRDVHATLAAEGRDFADVAAALPELFGAAREQASAKHELERWRVLAQVQRDCLARLFAMGRSDPHAGRWAALRAGALLPPAHAVLVGIVELNALTRALLEALGPRVTALVAAPESEHAAFNAWGAARVEPWSARALPLDRATWIVADTPDDQAARAVAVLDAWVAQAGTAGREARAGDGGSRAGGAGNGGPPETLARPPRGAAAGGIDALCAVPDDAVVPFLVRRLEERGVRARPGTAGAFRDSPAGTLLAALHALLATGRFVALADLARHPSAHAALARHPALAGRDPLALLDAAQTEHLPGRVCGPGAPRTRWPTLAPVLEALSALLGELLAGRPRAWSAWAAPIAEALSALVGDAALLPEAEDSHTLHASLTVLADALEELATLPAPEAAGATGAIAGGDVAAHEALALLLRACAAAEVPPRADSDAVDLLGWLETPLDEAPDLVLTGFNAGALPAAPASARWLPEELRRALGVPGERERLARDACLLAQVLHGRSRVALVSGRVGSERDPLLPSPLAFQVPDVDVPASVRTWLAGGAVAPVAPDAPAAPPARVARPLPRLPLEPEPRGVSVTGLRAFLSAPYGYYLRHVLHLQRAEDDAQELDPRGFGTLAHAALQAFGQGPARDSDDADAVRDALHAALDAEVAARFGPQPLPAVAVQVEQLRYRLARFACWQAQAAHDGWRIAAVEWMPPEPVTLDVGGEAVVLRGRIDRIDVHADGRWRVLDYKVGDKVDEPERTHRAADGTWRDLQLPLYALLVRAFAAEHGLIEPPQLGYLALPRKAEEDCALVAAWSEADLAEAHDAARAALVRVLAGDFFEAPEGSLGDPILDAIAGLGLLESAADDGGAGGSGGPGDAGDDA